MKAMEYGAKDHSESFIDIASGHLVRAPQASCTSDFCEINNLNVGGRDDPCDTRTSQWTSWYTNLVAICPHRNL